MDISNLPPASSSQNFSTKNTGASEVFANASSAPKQEIDGTTNKATLTENATLSVQQEKLEPLTSEQKDEATKTLIFAGAKFRKTLEGSIDFYDKGLREIKTKDLSLLHKEWDLSVENSKLVVKGEDLTEDKKETILATFDDERFKNDLSILQESVISLSSIPVERGSPSRSVSHFDLNENNISNVFSFRESIEKMKNESNYQTHSDLSEQMLTRGGDYIKEDGLKLRFVEVEV